MLEQTVIRGSVPEGKIRCFISDKLRENKPEERRRQIVARSLVKEYEYPKRDIKIEFPIKMGSATKRADIVVFHHNKNHKQENIKIIVEVKREKIKPSNKNNGVKQLLSYLSACMNVDFGLWVGSERIAYKVKRKRGKRITHEQVPDITKFGQTTLPPPNTEELTPAVNLKQVFKRIHNFIYANQGLQKDKAFEELLKIIFIKVYDEEYNTPVQFYISEDEDIKDVRKRIKSIYKDVKIKFDVIFDEKESILLNNEVLRYIVSELQRFSLVNTPTDVKGEAYEEVVGPNLRGNRGEFFTPRNVCKMMVNMVFSLFETKKVMRPGGIKVLDPAVGTGGFLIETIQNVKNHFKEQGLNSGIIYKRVKDIANNNFYGIDFNPSLVRASQMNMVMHGDGYSNIVKANSLRKRNDWKRKIRNLIEFEDFDIVITNPPFGTEAVIEDVNILEQYDFMTFKSTNSRNSLPPEQLFIERCLQFLKPEGILAIVLPDSILSNPGLEWIRDWLLKHTQIIASIDLPVETFEPHTGTQTSVLILRKKDLEKKYEKNYEIFMATPQKVGHDRRGKPIFKKDTKGKVKLDENGVAKINDDLPSITSSFKEWLERKGISY
ncbi:MAG: restriction endonuclease subunit M [Candidatus Woesearchaeota archaeon]